jgi:hypothetical protein
MKVVLADVNEAALKDAADTCRATGLTALPVVTDVSDSASVRHLADAAYGEFGAVHVLQQRGSSERDHGGNQVETRQPGGDGPALSVIGLGCTT